MATTTDLPAPVARRLRRPGIRDPRFLVGVALVVLSALGGSWYVRASAQLVPVYAASGPLIPGQALETGSLSVVMVRGIDTGLYLSADQSLPASATVLRVVDAGELVPASAVGDSQTLDLRPVVVPLHRTPSSALVVGATVELWLTPDELPGSSLTSSKSVDPIRIVHAATVATVSDTRDSYLTGAGTAEVLVPSAELPAVLAALAGDGTVDVVVIAGSG